MAGKKRVRRTFTEEFKQTAAKRVADGEKAAAVASEIGVSLNSLRSWKEKPFIIGSSHIVEPTRSATNLRQEYELLKAENDYLKRREEILRK